MKVRSYLFVVSICLAMLVGFPISQAATIVATHMVDQSDDPTVVQPGCTLRDALKIINDQNAPGFDPVTWSANLGCVIDESQSSLGIDDQIQFGSFTVQGQQVFHLAFGPLSIGRSMKISGILSNALDTNVSIIDGCDANQTQCFSIANILPNQEPMISVLIRDVRFRNGQHINANGEYSDVGCIHSDHADLTLERTFFEGCIGRYVGALNVRSGKLEIKSSEFTRNVARAFDLTTSLNTNAGAVQYFGEQLFIDQSQFIQNQIFGIGRASAVVDVRKSGTNIHQVQIKNSSFIENLAYSGPAVKITGNPMDTNAVVENNTFVKNQNTRDLFEDFYNVSAFLLDDVVAQSVNTKINFSFNTVYENKSAFGKAVGIAFFENSFSSYEISFFNNVISGNKNIFDPVKEAITVGNNQAIDPQINLESKNNVFSSNVSGDWSSGPNLIANDPLLHDLAVSYPYNPVDGQWLVRPFKMYACKPKLGSPAIGLADLSLSPIDHDQLHVETTLGTVLIDRPRPGLAVASSVYDPVLNTPAGGEAGSVELVDFSTPTEFYQGINTKISTSVEQASYLRVYPNPVSREGELTIDMDFQKYPNSSYGLMDMTGKQVHRGNLNVSSNRIDLNPLQLTPGVYVIQIQAKGTTFAQKIKVY
ncbi:MAG: T9SS type A sorting domain-containing protein [Bdellovibrionota bacterium]